MTEGIIQKTFREHTNDVWSSKKQGGIGAYDVLMHELISEIQEEITPYGSDLSRQKIYELLFGDGKN